MANNSDRRAYSTGASEEAQAEFNRVAGILEDLIARRDQDVQKAMSDYTAEGVSEDYRAKEQRWKRAADEVKGIITVLRGSLESNDQTAAQTGSKARAAVENIG